MQITVKSLEFLKTVINSSKKKIEIHLKEKNVNTLKVNCKK